VKRIQQIHDRQKKLLKWLAENDTQLIERQRLINRHLAGWLKTTTLLDDDFNTIDEQTLLEFNRLQTTVSTRKDAVTASSESESVTFVTQSKSASTSRTTSSTPISKAAVPLPSTKDHSASVQRPKRTRSASMTVEVQQPAEKRSIPELNFSGDGNRQLKDLIQQHCFKIHKVRTKYILPELLNISGQFPGGVGICFGTTPSGEAVVGNISTEAEVTLPEHAAYELKVDSIVPLPEQLTCKTLTAAHIIILKKN